LPAFIVRTFSTSACFARKQRPQAIETEEMRVDDVEVLTSAAGTAALERRQA
jgi:hypothetical protein